MANSSSYIEQCVSVIQSVDPEQLGASGLADEFHEGSSVRVYGLDQSGVIAGLRAVLKLPTWGLNAPDRRLISELTDANLIAARVPRLMPQLPRFMGLLAIEGDAAPAAIITEDATNGGAYGLWPMPVSERADAELRAGFNDCGPDNPFNEQALRRSLAFEVDGRQGESWQRLLDFTPSPFSRSFRLHSSMQRQHEAAVYTVSLGQLTVTIPRESRLSLALGEIAE